MQLPVFGVLTAAPSLQWRLITAAFEITWEPSLKRKKTPWLRNHQQYFLKLRTRLHQALHSSNLFHTVTCDIPHVRAWRVAVWVEVDICPHRRDKHWGILIGRRHVEFWLAISTCESIACVKNASVTQRVTTQPVAHAAPQLGIGFGMGDNHYYFRIW